MTTEGWDSVEPIAQDYYDLTDLTLAIQAAKEMCAEWSYEDDPHGYCHVRSILLRLIEAASRP